MKKIKVASLVLGLAAGWLFAAVVITPPLEAYDGWVALVLVLVAWILSIFDK